MAEISALMVKELREKTGAGMMDCKKALEETSGDMEKAIDYLREKGLAQAAKKSGRLASEGLVEVTVNDNFTKGSIVEINSETDFVAKNDKFKDFIKLTNKIIQENDIKDVEELKNINVNDQKFEEYLNSQIAIIGENIVVRRFATLKGEVVNGYLHSNGRVAVLIAANCGGADKSKVAEFLRNIAIHAAAMKPSVLSYNDFDAEFLKKELVALKGELEKENEEFARLGKPLNNIPEFGSMAELTDDVKENALNKIKEELKSQNKPEKIWDKIIPGKMERFFADNTLLDQRYTLLGQFFVMDDKKTIAQVIEEKSKELGGDIKITSFIRYEVGEGLEKRNEDFAAEVAAQIG